MSLPGITNEPILVTALVMIVIGAVSCFAGYRVFRMLLSLGGFVAGVALGLALANSLTLPADQQTIVRLVLALGGGLIGAAVAWLLFLVAVFFWGAAFGYLVASAITVNTGDPTRLVLILVLVLAGGVVALVFQKLFITLSTAFGGALVMVSGAYRFLTQRSGADLLLNPGLLLRPNAAQSLGTLYFLMLLLGVILGVLGFLVQYRAIGQGGRRMVNWR